jgi:protein ImuA
MSLPLLSLAASGDGLGRTPARDFPLAGPRPAAPALEAGRLHEALPARGGEAAALAFLLAAAPAGAGALVWVQEAQAARESGALYAPGLVSLGRDPADLILVVARKRMDALWAAEEGLKRSQARVLLELAPGGRPLDLTATRRLALAAETHTATALVLRADIGAAEPVPSAAWTRWRIAPAASAAAHRDEVGAPAFAATLFRCRAGRRAQAFRMELDHGALHAGAHETRETLDGALASAPVDGSIGKRGARCAVG